MDFNPKNYTVARGELWFTPFLSGTRTLDPVGARYIGNTPEITLSTDTENLDHYDADHGLREKDDTVVLEKNITGTFSADDINMENIAMLFLGTAGVVTQTAQTAQTETFIGVKKGRAFQLGVTAANPSGVRGIANVSVTATLGGVGAGVPLVENVDFRYEAAIGRVILLTAGNKLTDDPDDKIEIEYDIQATQYLQAISGDLQIQGRLEYIAYNTKGEKIDQLFPMVNIRPDGDYSLGGDDWQIMNFAFDALKLDAQTATIYTNGRPGRGITNPTT